jgi:hypothetical protein
VRGFRSAFRDWAGDETQFPREVAEAALAHAVGDETERAYRRGDALMKRRELIPHGLIGSKARRSGYVRYEKGRQVPVVRLAAPPRD